MKTFFASKYPIVTSYDSDGGRTIAPAGTIFTIDCISAGLFEILPIQKDPNIKHGIAVDAMMLQVGFTQQDSV